MTQPDLKLRADVAVLRFFVIAFDQVGIVFFLFGLGNMWEYLNEKLMRRYYAAVREAKETDDA